MTEKKILIVDFDEESLVALSDLVNEEGFKAVTVTDGLAGYEKFKSDDFDLVILEPMLPKLHGFELCKKINQDPLKKIPIIVVTGIYREPTCKAEALQVYGASAFFTKPWNKEELRAKILELLASSREVPAHESRLPRQEMAANPSPRPEAPVARTTSQQTSKFSSDLDEIEKELRQAVASLGAPLRKKEIKEKKAPKKDLDQEVEAILKGNIDVLGLGETKKKSTSTRIASPEPAPRPKPASPSPPDLWSWKEERAVQEAEETKKEIPFPEVSTNNIPTSSSRVLDTESTPFGIQRTLLEVDRIPLDLEKPKPEVETESVKEERRDLEEARKKYLFDEYAEPKKKKTILFAASGLAAVLVLVTSLTFVFKSRKHSQGQKETVSSVSQLPADFAFRQQEIGGSEASKTMTPSAARKPEVKKPLSSQQGAQSTQAEEIIPPVVPMDIPPVELHVEAETPQESPPATEQTPLPSAPSNAEGTSAQAPPAAPTQEEPAPTAKIQPGALVPLTNVTIPPVLLKRVDPKYPPSALTLGLEGAVTVNALISETGTVIRTEILKGVKGNYGFEKAAENAVRQWLFKPAQKDGVSVKVWKPIEIIFKLNKIPTKE